MPALVTVNVEPRKLGGLERPGTSPLGERVDVVPELLDGTRVAVAHDGDEQALLGLHGDAEVVAVEVDDLVAFEARVQLGKLAQRLRGRAEDEGQQQRKVDAAEVALLDVGHGGDLPVRARQVLGDLAPDAAQRLATALRRL